MKQKRIFIIIALLIAVLLLGIGYAAISAIPLNINGSATATSAQDNFAVKFTGTPTCSDGATASITDDTHATINVAGLTAKGDEATVTYTIQNDSADVSAQLSALINENCDPEGTSFDVADYFETSYVFGNNSTTEIIAKGGTTTITVKVKLLKTIVSTDRKATIDVAITAIPKQPTT